MRMKLRNLKNNQVICEDLKQCKSIWDKTLGLINPRNPRHLMLETRYGIHSFFLKKPIDVLVLDKKFRVVKIKQSLKPNRILFWDRRYSKVIELPEGSILKYRVALGDTLSIS